MSDKPIKVCMVGYTLYMTDARIKAYVRSLEKRGIETDAIVLQESGKGREEKTNSGVIYYLTKKYRGSNSVRYVLSYFQFFLAAFFKLTTLHLRKRYTTIHVHNMPNFIVFTAIIPKILGARIILDVHDLMTANYMAKFSVKDDHWLIRLLKFEQKLSAAFVDIVLCADHQQKEMLAQYGIPKEKITVMMNVANEDIFKPVTCEKHEEKFQLVYHGTVAERLGIDILLRAMALVKDRMPVFLSVYGDGDYINECMKLRENLKLEDCVYFSASAFNVEDVPKMISIMDVGIVPNKKTPATDRFMMPVKLMECVHLQIPVIAPRLRIIQRYFDETMIKYFEPENVENLARCIVELYENPEERKILVKNTNKFIEKHNWKTQEKEYLKLILSGNHTN